MVIVALTVGPVLFSRPGAFDPAYVLHFVYLSLCVFTVVTIGWTAIRWKNDVERFRGRHFRILAVVVFLVACTVFSAGAATSSGLAMILSWVGVAYGAAMMWFAWMVREPHPKWWLTWHLHAACGLFTAVHGTLLALGWRALIDPQADQAIAVTMQGVVLVIAVAMRLRLGYKHNVPWASADLSLQRSHLRGERTSAPTKSTSAGVLPRSARARRAVC